MRIIGPIDLKVKIKTVPNSITDVQGLRVGHYTDVEHATGCTVVLAPPEGAVARVDVRGPAPATRETDLLRPEWTKSS